MCVCERERENEQAEQKVLTNFSHFVLGRQSSGAGISKLLIEMENVA